MSASCFITWNASTSALTAPLTGTTTSATSGTQKTILQLAAPSSSKIRIIEWGYRITATPTAPLLIELLQTDVAATVSAGSISNYNDVSGSSSLCSTGTSATGYNASAEGTITATRLLQETYDSATYFLQQFPLGREPEIAAGKFLRIRATPTTAASSVVVGHIVWEE